MRSETDFDRILLNTLNHRDRHQRRVRSHLVQELGFRHVSLVFSSCRWWNDRFAFCLSRMFLYLVYLLQSFQFTIISMSHVQWLILLQMNWNTFNLHICMVIVFVQWITIRSIMKRNWWRTTWRSTWWRFLVLKNIITYLQDIFVSAACESVQLLELCLHILFTSYANCSPTDCIYIHILFTVIAILIFKQLRLLFAFFMTMMDLN